MESFEEKVIRYGLYTLAVLVVSFALYSIKPFYIVNPGFTAVHLRLGRIRNTNSTAGIYFKVPFIDRIDLINNRIRKKTIETVALSKDLQTVSVGIAINYRITDVHSLYQTTGVDFPRIILLPFAQESIKAGIAKYTAEDLIQYRHEVKEKVLEDLRARLAPLNIHLIDINFVHSDFSSDFIAAVERKQIAEQEGKRQKNLTEKIREEAAQTMLQADAEAYVLKIKKDMTTPELLQLKAIEKWDGKLPTMMNTAVPFLQMK